MIVYAVSEAADNAGKWLIGRKLTCPLDGKYSYHLAF